jgi:hypothetical protein
MLTATSTANSRSRKFVDRPAVVVAACMAAIVVAIACMGTSNRFVNVGEFEC